MGHSLGEYAAAHVAGMLPLDDAIRLVAERGRLTQKIANSGAMAAVLAPIEIVAREIDESGGALTIAAYNGPEHYVLSGPRPAVETALARLETAGVEAKLLRVSYAAHSTLIDPVVPSFERALETIKFNPARVALVSNVTGLLGMEEMVDPKYWLTQMRAPVQFAKSIATLVEQGVTHFVEIGPHPVLLGMGAECVPGAPAEWLPSLRRNRADWCDLLESLQRLYVGGADVDWIGFDRDYRRRRVALPTYPFRRRRHWVDAIGNPAETATIKSLQWPHTIMAIEREADRGPVGVDLSNYPAKWACLERLTNAYSSAVLRKAGIFTRPGDRLTVQEVCNKLVLLKNINIYCYAGSGVSPARGSFALMMRPLLPISHSRYPIWLRDGLRRKPRFSITSHCSLTSGTVVRYCTKFLLGGSHQSRHFSLRVHLS